jgi:adenosylhomocysteine nucleosidase
MLVLVTFAVEAEFAPWRKLRHFVPRKNTSVPVWTTKIEGAEVTVLLTGIGDSSERSMGLMMQEVPAGPYFNVCISSGLAGALRADLSRGEVIVADRFKTHKVHAHPRMEILEADRELVELAAFCGAKRVATLFSANHVLSSAKEKSLLCESADAVDMESFTIANEVCPWGARVVAIRAISDAASEDLPIDFNRTLSSRKAVSIPRVFSELAKKPGALPSLIRFGRNSRHAAQRLAEFLDEYVKRVGNRLSATAREGAVAR